MAVTFDNNIATISKALASDIQGFLEEVGGEVQSQARRVVRVDTGKTKGSYDYKVQESEAEVEVQVGSDYQNAIYEEFGTGEYALHGDGRKGGWTYQDAKGKWHKTHGKSPKRPLYTAFSNTAPKIEKRLANILKTAGG